MKSYQYSTSPQPPGLAVADHISAMLAYWDRDLICRSANPAYLAWFGRTREEMVDKITIMELLGPLYQKNEPYILAALNGEPQTFEREITLPNGSIKQTIANYFPDIVDGIVQGFYVHVADVTPIKQLETELVRSNKIINEQNKRLLNFTNIVSHNLNTYAHNLEGIFELLADADTEDEKNDLLGKLKGVVKAFGITIKNLNGIADVQNQDKLKYEWVNLYASIENAIGILNKQVKDTDTTITNHVNADIKLWINAAYTDSIILNFLTNAIKYRHPDRKPVIELRAAVIGKELALGIKDNGIGIDLVKHGKNLFGMYKTFHGNADAKGVGLFITKFQAEAMGARIEAESEVNKGTTFTVYFPLKAAQVPV